MDVFRFTAGGGTSTNAQKKVTGTIGQPDADVTLTGEGFSLQGGIWSIYHLIQTSGAPRLSIRQEGSLVVIDWPNAGAEGFVLQYATSVRGPWSDVPQAPEPEQDRMVLRVFPISSDVFLRLYRGIP